MNATSYHMVSGNTIKTLTDCASPMESMKNGGDRRRAYPMIIFGLIRFLASWPSLDIINIVIGLSSPEAQSF